MNEITKLANLGDRNAITELRERITQLETQDGPGYGVCLEFYKRIVAEIGRCEIAAFKAGMVAKDAGAEFDEANDWFDAYVEDEAEKVK